MRYIDKWKRFGILCVKNEYKHKGTHAHTHIQMFHNSKGNQEREVESDGVVPMLEKHRMEKLSCEMIVICICTVAFMQPKAHEQTAHNNNNKRTENNKKKEHTKWKFEFEALSTDIKYIVKATNEWKRQQQE